MDLNGKLDQSDRGNATLILEVVIWSHTDRDLDQTFIIRVINGINILIKYQIIHLTLTKMISSMVLVVQNYYDSYTKRTSYPPMGPAKKVQTYL